MPDPHTVELQHWTNTRLPAGHRLAERWSILFKGKAIMTFESEAEARRAAKGYGWVVASGEDIMPTGERVLIYGSRTWFDEGPINEAVQALDPDAVVISGGAAGADHIAWQVARARGLKTEVYMADWRAHGKGAGHIRNQRMLDEGRPTRAIGFRMPGTSNGTDDMTRRLAKAGIPHTVTEHQLATDAARIAADSADGEG